LNGNSAGSGSVNSGFVGGGGIGNGGATVNISNSTISGNSSGCNCGGGGIATIFGGVTNLRNVTIANNNASAGPGGGIISSLPVSGAALGTTNLSNTIVADNTATANPDVNGSIVSQGYNLVRTRGTSTGYVASDQPDGADPKLGPLANYGGPTETHSLESSSAAIDQGNSTLMTDQRGFMRPIDNPSFSNAPGGNGSDIGAFEALGTTAGAVTVGGRVLTPTGRGIRNVLVTLTDSGGNARTAITSSFGYFSFEDISAGETYIISVSAKRYRFDQPMRVLSVNEDLTGVDFTAQQ